MKRLLLCTILTLVPASAFADECEAARNMAENFMAARLDGVPKKTMLKQVGKDQYARNVLDDAYSVPLFGGESKAQTIRRYANDIASICAEGADGE